MFVFVYIWVHLNSLFLALSSVTMIIFSFPLTQFIYTVIFNIDYNTDMNQLTIFIILGIAADNTFVLIDAWK